MFCDISKKIFISGMLYGHHHKHSTELLNFFFKGVSRFSNNIIFKALEAMFSISIFKSFISRIFTTTRHYKRNSCYCFTFLFYSKDCYYIVSSLFTTFMEKLYRTYKNFFRFYFLFKPKRGFLTTQAKLESDKFL